MIFDNFPLNQKLLDTLKKLNFIEPTPIQEQAIPSLLEGKDLVGIAQTGTGKTLAFSLPLLHTLSQGASRARMPRSIILAPTRELAAQNIKTLQPLLEATGLKAALIIGGESQADQRKLLQDGVDVLVATPGRLLDLFDRGAILLLQVRHVIIDEADRMLDMGFIPDVEKILKHVSPAQRQIVLFSATMPPAIEKLAQTFLKSPVQITVAPPASTNKNLEQTFLLTREKERFDVLKELLRTEKDQTQVIIFVNRKRDIETLSNLLKPLEPKLGVFHGDIPQSQRTLVLSDFHENKIRLLIASDVAARGLDVHGLSHVFNMEIPTSTDDYIHRVGRTGRAGRSGKAFTFFTPREEKSFRKLEKVADTAFFVDTRSTTEKNQFPFHTRLSAAPFFEESLISKEKEAPAEKKRQQPKDTPPQKGGSPKKDAPQRKEAIPDITPTGFGAHTPFFMQQD